MTSEHTSSRFLPSCLMFSVLAYLWLPCAQAQVSRSYDNWRDRGVGGRTVLNQFLRIGGDEFADDCVLADWSPGFVNDAAWTIVNMSETNALFGFRATFRFYDEDGMLLGSRTNFFGLPLPAQRGAKLFSEGGLWRSLNIPTRERMSMSIQFSEPQGIDLADFGLLYGGPINVGSSSSFITNRTTGQRIDLGPNNNLGYFIDTVPIPAPAASVVLGVGLLAFGARRRRSHA